MADAKKATKKSSALAIATSLPGTTPPVLQGAEPVAGVSSSQKEQAADEEAKKRREEQVAKKKAARKQVRSSFYVTFSATPPNPLDMVS